MGARVDEGDSHRDAVLEVEEENAAPQALGKAPRLSIEDVLAGSAAGDAASRANVAASPVAGVGMRTARVIRTAGRKATLAFRGVDAPVEAEIAPEVDPEVIADAGANGDAVLVELAPGEAPLVVAALQTRKPREIRLRAATIHIEGDQEVLLRSGHGAIRIREDGDIEVVGSRISAASRGLFRIVGRLLRLN